MNLVERLRSHANWCISCAGGNIPDEAATEIEAADAIERLQKELETAREALEPFARVADSYEPDEGDDACVAWAHDFTIGSLRRARDARRTTKGGGE